MRATIVIGGGYKGLEEFRQLRLVACPLTRAAKSKASLGG
jgi:hypothetical protein